MTFIGLNGATGYTGGLVARELVAKGLSPVLIGRDRARVDRLGRELGGLDTVAVPAGDPAALAAVLPPGSVLISTVGPFSRLGGTAAEAAIEAKADYLDSNGEPAFTRSVFESFGPKAALSGRRMITSCAPEWILGNVAGALAIVRAPSAAVRLDIGYFVVDSSGRPLSLATQLRGFAGGSLASGVELVGRPSFAWRESRLVAERWARHRRTFLVSGKRLIGVSHGGTEHFALPRQFPALSEVNVFLGWFSPWGRAIQLVSAVGGVALRPSPIRRALERLLVRSRPSEKMGKNQSRSLTVASTYDCDGKELAQAVLEGPDLYRLTAHLLAWGAAEVGSGRVNGEGALGPVEAFGLERLVASLEEGGVTVGGADPRNGATSGE